LFFRDENRSDSMNSPRSKLVSLGNALALALTLVAVGSVAFVYVRWLVREYRYTRIIEQVAPKFAASGPDKFLIKAVMRQESGFDPFAQSKSGAVGLMQVMPANAPALGVSANRLATDERTNIEAGAQLLAHALAFWRTQPVDDPIPFALAEYNAGRPLVLRWAPQGQRQTAAEFLAKMPNRNVRYYVERVLEFYAEYKDADNL
jgi:soluble lytic murein transglycosylase